MPFHRIRRASSSARAARQPSSPPRAARSPLLRYRAARAARRNTGPSLSLEELRVGQKAHRVAFRDRLLGGIVEQAVGPRGRGQHRRILGRIEIEAAPLVPFYAQELAPRVGLGPVEVGARFDVFRLYR